VAVGQGPRPNIARETRALAREIGLAPCTKPIESPLSNRIAEAFVKAFKRDYARVSRRPDAAAVLRRLDRWHCAHLAGSVAGRALFLYKYNDPKYT
jgi:hypothetical protein